MFAQEWEMLYRANSHMSVWPWSDLVSYVHRYAKPSEGFRRVLELGCGAGANIPLFLKLEAEYFAVEGSETIVAQLLEKYPNLASRIVAGDFTQTIPFEGLFDLIVDRVSLPHNRTEDISRTLSMIFRQLRHGGKFIGIDWFSTAHQDARSGDELDSYTRGNLTSGHLAGTGVVHFFDREHLLDLLMKAGFVLERLEHKQSDILIPEAGRLGWWNFVAVKP